MRTKIIGIAVASALLLVGATNWDGVATLDPSGDLPGGGYSIATNAFPRNTVLDVTNLENNKTVRVFVVSGLGASGLLAILSRNTAEALEIHGNSVSRIRMVQPPDDIAYSYLRQLGLVSSAEAPAPLLVEPTPASVAGTPAAPPPGQESVPHSLPASQAIAVVPAPLLVEPTSASVAGTPVMPPSERVRAPDIRPVMEAIVKIDPEHPLENLVIVPSHERIPESGEIVIAEENMLPPIAPPGFAAGEHEYVLIDGIRPENTSATAAAGTDSQNFSPFQAPLISGLQRNKWYVQVAAYARPDYVEDEISRIGKEYPLAIQNIGTDTSPMFRVLLGPLNQGESGAVLQRVKSIGYKNAFARRG
ncbi:MAG: SPOR domain-containing protein [Treponema sp.]|jgi:hypothetical protein|nr:SPOR domain-containing protein [Treponema sp.]